MAVYSNVLHADYLISDGSIYLKVLVPSVAAGAIIGIGGETIDQVQKEVNARIKMSKANDFYPGTIFNIQVILFMLKCEFFSLQVQQRESV